jgi:hypothetical protein
VALVRTDVSEEGIAYNHRMERTRELRTTLGVTSNVQRTIIHYSGSGQQLQTHQVKSSGFSAPVSMTVFGITGEHDRGGLGTQRSVNTNQDATGRKRYVIDTS